MPKKSQINEYNDITKLCGIDNIYGIFPTVILNKEIFHKLFSMLHKLQLNKITLIKGRLLASLLAYLVTLIIKVLKISVE